MAGRHACRHGDGALAGRRRGDRPCAGLHAGAGRCADHTRARGAEHLGAAAGTGARGDRAALRRGAARAQARARPAGVAGNRQDPAGRAGRGAGDDRYLRLRRGPVAPAARADHRLGAPATRDARDLAPVRPVRRDLGLQLPGGGVGVECGARAGVRQRRAVEAVGEGVAVRAGRARAARARAGRGGAAACRHHRGAAGRAHAWQPPGATPGGAAGQRDRLDPHGPRGRHRLRRAVQAQHS
ncbi:hypothetical protein D9M70_456850 [compost metagenome]